MHGAQSWITQFYLQLHQCLPSPRNRSPDGASPDWGCGHSLLLIYLPLKDERLSRPGWLTYSGRLAHVSGHPSAGGRVQDGESSPVKDQCSTAVPRNQPTVTYLRVLLHLLSSGSTVYTRVLLTLKRLVCLWHSACVQWRSWFRTRKSYLLLAYLITYVHTGTVRLQFYRVIWCRWRRLYDWYLPNHLWFVYARWPSMCWTWTLLSRDVRKTEIRFVFGF